jgi:hypothetical protein
MVDFGDLIINMSLVFVNIHFHWMDTKYLRMSIINKSCRLACKYMDLEKRLV